MYARRIKRLFDIMIAIIGFPIFIIVSLIVAPAIIIDDGFPIFYNAQRIGQKGKLFKMYKFRTMKNNSPDIRLEDGSTYNSSDDPRVTRVGKVLRSTSIDEVPQLLNILKGEMSLIGPRPDPPDWLDRYPEDIKVFLEVKPGITGLSQAYYRNSVSSEEKMKNDAFYAEHITFKLDIKIFIKTIFIVLGRDNIYRDLSKVGSHLDVKSKKELSKLIGSQGK